MNGIGYPEALTALSLELTNPQNSLTLLEQDVVKRAVVESKTTAFWPDYREIMDLYDKTFHSNAKVKMDSIETTLAERGKRYGDFDDNAVVSQQLKHLVQHFYTDRHRPVHKEALEMIVQKIARILNGDPEYKDNWHDIAGYAKLAEERCRDA